MCQLAQECPVPPALLLVCLYFMNQGPVFLIILRKVVWIQHIPVIHLCKIGSVSVVDGI